MRPLITDSVRSTRGGYIFSLSVSSHRGGGVPHPAGRGGGTPSSWLGGGTPSHPAGRGGTPSSWPGWGGYPIQLAGGDPSWVTPPSRGTPRQWYPSPPAGGTPPAGVPPGWGVPPPAGVTPPTDWGRRSVCLLAFTQEDFLVLQMTAGMKTQ